MKIAIATPFYELESNRTRIYGENHFITYLNNSPKLFTLIYTRDLGFTNKPVPQFQPLKPVYDSSSYLQFLAKEVSNLYKNYSEHIVSFPSFKETLRYVLTVIIGFGKKAPRAKVNKHDTELFNAIYYVKDVLKLNPESNFRVLSMKWLNLELTLDNNKLHATIIRNNRKNEYRILELLYAQDTILGDYLAKLVSRRV